MKTNESNNNKKNIMKNVDHQTSSIIAIHSISCYESCDVNRLIILSLTCSFFPCPDPSVCHSSPSPYVTLVCMKCNFCSFLMMILVFSVQLVFDTLLQVTLYWLCPAQDVDFCCCCGCCKMTEMGVLHVHRNHNIFEQSHRHKIIYFQFECMYYWMIACLLYSYTVAINNLVDDFFFNFSFFFSFVYFQAISSTQIYKLTTRTENLSIEWVFQIKYIIIILNIFASLSGGRMVSVGALAVTLQNIVYSFIFAFRCGSLVQESLANWQLTNNWQ